MHKGLMQAAVTPRVGTVIQFEPNTKEHGNNSRAHQNLPRAGLLGVDSSLGTAAPFMTHTREKEVLHSLSSSH